MGQFSKIALIPLFAFWAVAHNTPQTAGDMLPKSLQGAQIEDRIGSVVPMNIQLTNHDGEQVTLQNYFSLGKTVPVILTLGYYRCPMLCDLVMGGLVKALQQTSLQMGKDYSIVSVSIDSKESIETAAARRQSYLQSFIEKGEKADWHFHVGQQDEVKHLADSVGFGYRFDKASNEYAHAAGLFILSPNGKLNRVLYGIEYQPYELEQTLKEARMGKVGQLFERIVLSCFHYDPSSHRYGIYIFGVTRVLGGLTVVVLIFAVIALSIGKRRKRIS